MHTQPHQFLTRQPPNFAYLDSGISRPSLKKQRHAQWTNLEKALFES